MQPNADGVQDEDAPATAAVAVPPALAARPRSVKTTQFYARDWAGFAAWCRSGGVVPLPADAATIAAYLTALSARLSPGALAQRLAAIAAEHAQRGFVAPTRDPAVKAVLKAARRQAAPRRGPPPSAARLARMAAGCPGDLAGLRDRALLLLMQATGLGRAALVSLDAEAVRLTGAGCELRFTEEATWRTVQLTPSPDLATCPVHALQDWLRVSQTRFGPVFRKVDRWGNVEHQRLGTDAVRRILARRTPPRVRRKPASSSAAAPAADPAPSQTRRKKPPKPCWRG